MILASHGIIGSSISQFTSGLLDTYTGAAAAYSLRRLSIAYTGSAIRVRRASDNTEQDIGFVGEDLDTSTLTSFCSGTNGFVKTWYDQSGNARDATQATAASQPQIVSSGSVLTANSKPTIRFDGINDGLSLGTQTVGVSTMISVVKRNGVSGGSYHPIFTGSFTPQFFQFYVPNSTNISNLFFGSNLDTGQSFNTNLQTFQTYFDSTVQQYQNNVIGSTASATITDQTNGEFRLGFYNTNYLNGDFSEFIWYANSQLSNQNGIFSNLNSFYSL